MYDKITAALAVSVLGMAIASAPASAAEAAKPAAEAAAGAAPAAAKGEAKPKPKKRRAAKSKAGAAPVAAAPMTTAVTPKYNDVMTAVVNRDPAGAREILDLGAWADRRDSNGATALMAAARGGDAGMTELLLKYGANPNLSGPGGSVLDHAEKGGNAKVIALLKKAGGR